MAKYKSNLIAKTAKVIPYCKELRKITGSVTAAILFQQLEYWFSIKNGEPFYKFLSPVPDEKYGYKKGDSWTEELGFSESEFRTAFEKIGIAYKSKKAYDKARDKFVEIFGEKKMYCSYYDKIGRRTYYFRYHELVDFRIKGLLEDLSDNTNLKEDTSEDDIW